MMFFNTEPRWGYVIHGIDIALEEQKAKGKEIDEETIVDLKSSFKKGAFTGADEDREGVVDRALGGILFLDEIHRLPAAGQELLFMLIDKGKFRRLGEVQGEREA